MDENEYEFQIYVCSKKKRHRGKLYFTFFSPKNLVRLFILKEVRSCIILPSGQALSRWQNDTTSYT